MSQKERHLPELLIFMWLFELCWSVPILKGAWCRWVKMRGQIDPVEVKYQPGTSCLQKTFRNLRTERSIPFVRLAAK